MFTKHRGLTVRLLRFISLTVISSYAVLALTSYLLFREMAFDSAFLQTNLMLGQKEREINTHFTRIENLVRSLAANWSVTDERYPEMAEIFSAVSHAQTDIVTSVFYGSRDGRFLQRGWGSQALTANNGWAWHNLPFRPAAAPLLPDDFDHRQRPWYQSAESNAGFVVTSPYPFIAAPGSNAVWGFTAAIPVTTRTGEQIGVLGADCSLALLASFTTNSPLPAGGRLFLLDGRGNALYQDPAAQSNSVSNKQNPPIPPAARLFHNNKGQSIETIDDRRWLLSWRRETRSSLILLAACPADELVRPVFRPFYPLAGASLLTLVVLLAVIAKGMKKLTGPISNLIETIDRFSNRDFSARAEIPHAIAATEIGALARTFNTMAESIKQYDLTLLSRLYNDPLTGLPNRTRLLLELAGKQFPTLILVDIDAFKEINDFYGNTIGDLVLKQVAERLQQAFPGMRIFHLAADVYALLTDQAGQDYDIDLSLQWIRMSIQNEPFHCKDQEIIVHITCGAATQDNRQQEWPHEDILLHADMALKRAKQRLLPGLVYQPAMQITEEYQSNLTWVRRLKEALAGNRVVPVFQPIVDTRTNAVDKYECLVRIRDDAGHLVGPGTFLAIAHRARIYPELTKKMVSKCIKRFTNRSEDFSINLSMEDVRDPRTMGYLIDTMRKAGDTCRRLILELVETSEIEQNREFRDFIRQAKSLGARIAIDDFGAGYSNFSYLLEMEVDFIKIDASLIRNLVNDRNSQIVVQTIAGFARSLGIRTVAEFVDSKEVHEAVLGIGIDYCQGYYFGKPEPTLPGENPANH